MCPPQLNTMRTKKHNQPHTNQRTTNRARTSAAVVWQVETYVDEPETRLETLLVREPVIYPVLSPKATKHAHSTFQQQTTILKQQSVEQ